MEKKKHIPCLKQAHLCVKQLRIMNYQLRIILIVPLAVIAKI